MPICGHRRPIPSWQSCGLMGIPCHSPIRWGKGRLVACIQLSLPAAGAFAGKSGVWAPGPGIVHTRCLLSASSSGTQKATQSPSTDSGSAPKPKRRRVTACFAWNDGRACVTIPCHFQHICSRCGGDHKKSACPPTGEGRNPAQ